ncbi:sulfurtransferase TusA family protein [Thermodesulfatator autotrophicus]|uniref:Preprotein translocase subunit TatC n=1 Tax=Thermodesulfatator autotrophicus TaxID=1795632 RepID=A0A177E5T5_9BACT|nr:sulfurtransferase TusA family protein [Thermodesulfatator autotrophicus]OAG27265.1 preprotein translocase subunit TatC [Thermodesulfatator autotrophicus]
MADVKVAPEGIKADVTLDCKGLSCPMPLLKTKKAIQKLEKGQILEVLGTDPGSKNDIPGWCERSGHEFLGMKEESGYFVFYIKKG